MKLAFDLARIALAALSVVIVVLIGAGAAHAQTTLDTCGQVVRGQVVLAADLDCSAAADPFVTFDAPGTLSLGGHTFSGTIYANVQGLKIVGPGMITGPGHGIYSEGGLLHGPHIKVSDGAEISGNDGSAILVIANPGNRPSVSVQDASLSNNGSNASAVAVSTSAACPFLGCIPPSKIRVKRTTITGNGAGLGASNISVRDSTITGNILGIGLSFEYIRRKLAVRDSTIDDNTGQGVRLAAGAPGKIKIVRSSVSGNGIGILDQTRDEKSKIKVVETTLVGNGYAYSAEPVFAGSGNGAFGAVRSEISQSGFSAVHTPPGVQVKLASTPVDQSGSDSECGATIACADLDTGDLPRLSGGASCETSHVYGSGVPGMGWGVCTLD